MSQASICYREEEGPAIDLIQELAGQGIGRDGSSQLDLDDGEGEDLVELEGELVEVGKRGVPLLQLRPCRLLEPR